MDLASIFLLLGGVGLFLYGMQLMSDGLEAAAGSKMRRWLEVLTKNRFAGVAVGAGVTAVVQSSSATTVMLVGFVNAGLMSLKQAVNVLMGANIGTTITSQIIAFKVTDYAPIILFIGIIMMLFLRDKSVQKIGQIVAGFGILFMGITIMADATAPLKDWAPFVDILSSFENPFIGVLAGALFTAVIQSSSATMGILLALSATGAITLQNIMYVILGLNIGTCITAIIASLGANKTAKRTAAVHVSFNIFGTIIFLILLQLLDIEEWITSMSPDDVQRQLANFHTMFNIITTAILIWVPQLLIKISFLVVRGEDKKAEVVALKYLISSSLDNPPVAVSLAVKECARMAGLARDNMESAMKAFITKDEHLVRDIRELEGSVDRLNHLIAGNLVKISQEGLSKKDSMSINALLHIVMDIERISDHAENLAEFTEYEIENKLTLSEEGRQEIQEMMDCVSEAMNYAVEALSTGDRVKAQKVIAIEKIVDEQEGRLKNNHVTRLANGTCSPNASMVYTDLVTNLERVADHSTNIAYRVLDREISTH